MYKNLEKKLITEFIIFNILIIKIIPINNFIINITSLHFSFCTILSSDSFQRAKDKLKRAEMVTDVNTDVDETAKKRRKITAAKRLSSSDSEDEDTFADSLPAFPRQPIVRQQSENNSSLYYKGDTSCKKIVFTLMLLFTKRF